MTSEPEREVDDRLGEWVDGCMSDRERERFVAELRVSAQLRQDLEDYERTVANVRAALGAPTVRVPMADRVLAAIAAGKQAGPRAAAAPRRALLWGLVSAAALLGLAVLVNNWKPAPEDRVAVARDASPKPNEEMAELRAGKDDDRELDRLEMEPAREAAPPIAEVSRLGAKAAPEGNAAPAAPAVRGGLLSDSTGAGAPAPGAAAPPAGASAPTEPPEEAAAKDKSSKPTAKSPEPNQTKDERKQDKELGDAGARESVGGSEPLPHVVVQGVAIAALAKASGDEKASEPAEPLGKSRKRAADGPSSEPSQADGSGARGGAASADDLSRAPENLPARLDSFFKSQMQTAPAGGEAPTPWAASGSLRFSPLPRAPDAAKASARGPADTVPTAPGTNPAPAGPGSASSGAPADPAAAGGPVGSAGHARGGAAEAAVELSWLVEGSKDDVQLVLGRLARFARGSNLRLSTGETVAAPVPTPSDTPADSRNALTLGLGKDADSATMTRVVLTFRRLLR